MIRSLRESFTTALRAAKYNLLPGLLLQAILAIFLVAYLTHDGTRHLLDQVADLKRESGLWFTFISYALASALLPEILRVVFFQRGKVTRLNAWNCATAAVIWGLMGIMVDIFYRCQSFWFGTGNDLGTVAIKVLVDQFLYSPLLANPLSVSLLTWRNRGFAPSALRSILTPKFYVENIIPIQVAGWCIWIPAVSLVYFMPPALQVPVAALIQAFWTLILTTITERKRE